MICIQFCALYTIHHAAFNNTAEYTLFYSSKYALKTLLNAHPCRISNMIPIIPHNKFRTCLTLCSQLCSQDASKYTPSTFPGTPPSTFSSTLPRMLSRTYLTALNGTLAAIYALLYACKMLSSTLPRMFTNMSPIALYNSLPACLALFRHVHFQLARLSQFHLTIYSHVCFSVFDPETCRVADTRHQEADGR